MFQARLLNQFIAVAEELHFGRAALRLHMSQPPLSQAIKNLEGLVGVQLLTRTKHYVALTPAGAAFLDEARNLLAQGQRAIDVATRASRGLTGRVTVGFVGSVSYALLPSILRDFRSKYPYIHVDLRELTSIEQVQSLRAGKIDVGIVRLPLNSAADLQICTIAAERFIAALPRNHRLADVETLRLEDLADDTFMTFPADRTPSFYAKFMMACEEAGFSPRVTLEAWQMASMVSLAAAGIGVVLLPEQVTASPHSGVVYKALANRSDHLELKIASASRPHDSSAGVHAMLSIMNDIDRSRTI